MRVGIDHIDSVINALNSGKDPESLPVGEFSLGAACELGAWEADGGSCLSSAWQKHGLLVAASKLFRGHGSHTQLANGALLAIRSKEDLLQLPYDEFLMRFSALLKQHGFDLNGLHQGISGALEEMADNVVQHSSLDGQQLIGVAGYLVGDRSFEFAVGDLGIGVLASLRQNPEYANITMAREALDQIARHGASRRAGEEAGRGYKDLFKGLAQMNGTVRIRSDNGLFTMTGSLGSCLPSGNTLEHKKGFFVAVEGKI